MRPSRVLKRLRAGQVATCTKLNLAEPRAAEIAAQCGFDCIWLGNEHIPTDWLVLENMIRAAKIYDVDTLVRVSKGSYSDLLRPLEADAAGIMVPHLMSAEEARYIARTTRFHPLGRRPVDGGNADGAYAQVDFKEYLSTANRERFVVVQIEDPEPLEELEAIARVEGIDMLFFGPGDFSQGIGHPGEWDHPLIAEARARVAAACMENVKYAGTVCSADNAGELVEMGYRFLSIGADVVALGERFARWAHDLQAAIDSPV
jgi:4-hydroxy-2-oxoheptanedioate aldolase